ncbi:protein of unknown function [Saccharicrinis carchari]|uniref:DUF4301 domain-containing protein n=1 Tax=Saccharicrinis carchari TaxID=1168039 RepID=A0A521C1K5_SACCC|nr:DUF4301 family protein [Saccharicrinis carchari]SMO53268.1 protein of unknown function [Saccharicrinis carchari]
MTLTTTDLAQIKTLGILPEDVELQLERFKNGFPDIKLSSIASENKGIKILSQDALNHYINFYHTHLSAKKLVKFVPASGAASRMFKSLYKYLEDRVDKEDEDIKLFFNHINNFAFAGELFALLGDEKDRLIQNRDKKVIDTLLNEKGLNYGSLPKALLTFHQYADGQTTKAIDEHLIEGAQYCSDSENKVCLHFTVSDEHMVLIKTHLNKVKGKFEKRFGKTFELTFSVQDKATDTLAVDMNNEPFRLDDGSLLFRPGGHGALIKNLNDITADIVFIKNIDNVAAEWMIKDTVDYKKALGGLLLETQSVLFGYCNQLKDAQYLSESTEQEIINFLYTRLGFCVPENFGKKTERDKIAYLFNKLNRPLRICGVVKSSNTGGGPFWVRDADGALSLQLVETAQVNLNDHTQAEILNASEYANITDLVCGVKDFENKAFELLNYRDSDTGFIAEKSQSGKALKAMELPGLWNGAMSDWNTTFVEVPITTFNPVKTVLDLLNKEHQGH